MNTRLMIRHPLGIAALIFAALILVQCTLFQPPDIVKTTPSPYTIDNGSTEDGRGDREKYGITVQLVEGQAQLQTPVPLPVASGEPLTSGQIEAIFARLPALPVSLEDQSDFQYPVQLLPPPRPGLTIKERFPAPDWMQNPETPAVAPLQVLRYAPEGEISIAPFISITFNQAMVPLGTLGDLSALDVPVQIDPPLEGTWRWIGTRTLTFEYDSDLIDRLPKATGYTVTVPAGTKSINGGVLAQAVTWTFTTPAPVAVIMYPQDLPQPVDPLMFIAFDQRIDPGAVLKTIQVYAGSTPADLVLATPAEIESDETVNSYVQGAQAGRWLAFKSTRPFSADTQISITIGPGTPSSEGPLVTANAQSFGFRTYAPLRVEDHGCYWYSSTSACPPQTPLFITFNNSLDAQAFTQAMLRVDPEIPGLNVNPMGNSITLTGETKGQTEYTVTLSADLKDIFGQTLGSQQKLKFKIGKADSFLSGPQQNFITLDPAAKKPALSVYAINYDQLAVKIYAVQPEDWNDFAAYVREWQMQDRTPAMPGELVFDQTIALDIPDDTISEVLIDLSPYLKNGYGHFAVIVEPPKGLFESQDDKWKRFSQTIHVWAQVTRIGLDAYTDHSDMIVWANDLRDGTPLEGVRIDPNAGGDSFYTGEDGTARIAIPDGATTLVASQGKDRALLLQSPYVWESGGWQSTPVNDSLRWFVFDDRAMYRPGEAMHIKGWVRRTGGKQNGDVSMADGVDGIAYQLNDAQGNAIGSGRADVNRLGGFDFVFTLPDVVNLGHAGITLTAEGSWSGLDGTTSYHGFQIQEFRTPEFEVNARNETEPPYFADEHALLAVEAKYYAGGALPNAEVIWQVTSTPGHYAPPNWDDFVFGEWFPWWWDDYRFEKIGGPRAGGKTETFTGRTDSTGTHYLRLDFKREGEADQDPKPISITAQATVMDVNRQAWSSSTSLLVHPADVYIGLRSDRYFVEKGAPLKIDFIVTDLDGTPVSDQPVSIQAARLEWKWKDGEWVEEEVDVQDCSKRSGAQPDTCTFETPIGGTYQITAIVTDDQGRKNQTRFTRWVSGGQRPPSRNVEQEEVTLIPGRENYQPGDTAEILVQPPFTPAEGLLTISRSGFVETIRFAVEDGSTTLQIPIKDWYVPNVNIQVDLVGSAPRLSDAGETLPSLPHRPAYATAQLKLNVPPVERTLSVLVDPGQTKLEPGGETTIQVQLKDANGLPVPGAELAVIVVDEAILALTNYQMTDPIGIFYAERPSDVASVYGRSSVVLVNPESLLGQNGQHSLALPTQTAQSAVNFQSVEAVKEEALPMAGLRQAVPAPSADGQANNASQPPIALRSDFNPLAAFAPTARTGSNGEASVYVKLPDNLTRYRIMVVAVDATGRRFGTGASNLTARLPLMVRPSAPRFLNFGDQFELPVILQNQTDTDMLVDVVARATNLALDQAGKRVTVPANDRIEVRFPAGTIKAGTARIQVAAISGGNADAAVVEIPVNTPATTEAFATYGVIDDGSIAQPVLYPDGVFPQYGGLEISTSSTALQALTDAFLYLQSYPFECSEQLSSRVLSVAALRDVLAAFDAEGLPSPGEIEFAVERDIKRLQGMQNYDGGFPYWRRGFDSIPFNTIHATHALLRAKQKGFNVPQDMIDGSLVYLREIESHYPYWYSDQTRWTLSAYALYVRSLSGDRDAQKAQRLINDAGLENLSMEAIGWLWPVTDNGTQLDDIRRIVNNRVVETAGAANFTTAYTDQTYLLLSSDRRTDAILLDALIEDQPGSDLIAKVVNGLLAHRTKGRWENTQENVFVLLALDRYFNTYESQTPDFAARLWLGDTYAGSSEFRGRTTEIHETLIPMTYVMSETASGGGTQNLILSKEGAGRLYYRLGLKYAPTDLQLDPLDMGFVVLRKYEAVDRPGDVSQTGDGVWHIKAGARVRVRITFVADNRRYHVALVDPLPAGLEIVNPALAVSQNAPQEDPIARPYGWWWWGTWYEHQNLRDDRAEAFTSLLWDGVYDYTYIARATTPGTFVVPPTKAEEMYSPEVFGRGSSDVVIVE